MSEPAQLKDENTHIPKNTLQMAMHICTNVTVQTNHRVNSTPSIKLDIPVKHLEARGQESCGVGLQAPFIQNMKEVPVIAEQLSHANEREFVHLHHSGEHVVQVGLVLCDNKATHPSETGAAVLCRKKKKTIQ